MVVVLPSPGGVGDRAVTSTSRPSGRSASEARCVEVDLGLVVAVGHQVLLGDPEGLGRDLRDRAQDGCVGDLDVRQHLVDLSSWCVPCGRSAEDDGAVAVEQDP